MLCGVMAATLPALEHRRAAAAARQRRHRALERDRRGAYWVRPDLELVFDALAKSGWSDEELARRGLAEAAMTEALESWARWRLAQPK